VWKGEAVAWDTITRWMDQHVNRRVNVSITTNSPNGSTSAVVAATGVLRCDPETWTLMEPAPGRRLSCRVGDLHLLLIEGAVEDVDCGAAALAIDLAGASVILAPAG
jgi:hypothetical protein